ncbi:hypothetical protein PJN91_17175 [Mycobacterium kansasii]|uniref:Uncharacterized protein n=2 Tax=Mycobacterium ostraviense TaxID=2738409 RepID=A0A164B2U5_9MYCO|nr:hypothetical protein A4G28_04270 [Mycobacterium ostraviense]
MIGFVRVLTFIFAVAGSVCAVISKRAGMEVDCDAWLVVAIVGLGVFFGVKHVVDDAGRRLWMAAYRHDQWARRDREAGR